MDKEKIKVIINNLESLLETLKEEMLFEQNSLQEYEYEEIVPCINDYDEVFYDEDD